MGNQGDLKRWTNCFNRFKRDTKQGTKKPCFLFLMPNIFALVLSGVCKGHSLRTGQIRGMLANIPDSPNL